MSGFVALATAPGQYLEPYAAASWDRVAREVQRTYGWLPVLTDSARPLAEQKRIFLDRYDQQAVGSGYYGDVRRWEGRRYVRRRYRRSDGAPAAAAAVPGTSRHGLGLAVDCTGLGGFTGTRYRQLMAVQAKHGWSNAVGRTINEAWHQEYTRANDQYAGTGGGAVAPTTPQEDEDMGTPAENANAVLNYKHPVLGNKTIIEAIAALGRVPGDLNTVHQAVLHTPSATVQTLLGTRIKRAGQGKGETTPAAILAYVDDYVIRILGGQAQAGGTIDMAQVTAAIKAAADAALEDVEITLSTKPDA